MKQKEYLKLVVDATALEIKVKFLQEQFEAVAVDCEKHFFAANEKLRGIEVSLDKISKNPAQQDASELAITGITIKRLLHTIEKDLKNLVGHPVAQQNKQIATMREALQKLLTLKDAFDPDGKFDLAPIQEKIDYTQATLAAQDQKSQVILQRLGAIQEAISRFEEANSTIIIEQELQEAMQKTTLLSRKIANIEHCIEGAPDLKTKHLEQLAPLVKAFTALTTKTKLLDLTKDLPAVEEQPTTSAKAGKPHTSPAKRK